MTPDTVAPPAHAQARQKVEFRTGNEAAAIAARDIGFDLAGCLPASPPAVLAICYGAALGGARVLASASPQGLIDSLGQLSVQAGARVPMVLNLAARAAPGLPESGCDHTGLYHALDAGWIVLCARDPQAVYDFNLAAVRIGEHPDVRLPVLVAFDGVATSDQKRRIHVLDDAQALAGFVGTRAASPTPLDVSHPATFGARMDGADFLNHKVQVSLAMDAARRVVPEVFEALARLTGRSYAALDAYEVQDADAVIVLVNSAAEAARDAVDVWRGEGRKVGMLSPNVLRPFPADEFREQLRRVKAATVGDRAEAFGTGGGRLALEVRAAVQLDGDIHTPILSRLYGLGGSDFHATDAEQLLDAAFAVARSGEAGEPFAIHGATPGEPDHEPPPGLPAIAPKQLSRGMAKVRRDEATGRLHVELEPLWKMTSVPGRIAPGHRACPGCGAFTMLNQAYKVLEGDIVALFESGCAMVVSTGYPSTSHRVSYVHNMAGQGAATLAGLVEAYHERVRRGELPPSRDVTFVMVAGDGAMDAGIGAAIGAAHRNHRMIILEYDNQGRMSEGAEPSHSTALGRPRDTAQILAACHVPYVFTASEGYPEDLMRKVAKAQWYARHEGLAYGRILSFCPLHWQTADDAAEAVLHAAIDSCFFPLYEVERGHTAITYDPDATSRRKPVAEWLRLMGKTANLSDPANAGIVEAIQAETERRWARLKAMHEHPLL